MSPEMSPVSVCLLEMTVFLKKVSGYAVLLITFFACFYTHDKV